MPENEVKKNSELRQDLVSGEWVVIATGRAKRPNDFAVADEKKKEKKAEKKCPFEKLDGIITSVDLKGKVHDGEVENWFAAVIPNRFPAFSPEKECPSFKNVGPYHFIDGTGFHEVVVTRPHDRSLAEMTTEEAAAVIKAYRARMLNLAMEECIEFVSLLHNHGPEAGASVEHPHSQIIAIPVIPPDVAHSLSGSERYFIERKRCVHCAIMEFEREAGTRLIFENDHFIVFAPFASRAAFEIRIFPKLHNADFLNISDEEVAPLAEALRIALAKLFRGLNNPSYNFFIHSAPSKMTRGYAHYHWHLEILPKSAIWGGFEFSTGIEISTIAPEDAAEFLRSIEVS